ncbi:hypothetical protein BKA93DRAFT_800922 [Sparassis latifolia]
MSTTAEQLKTLSSALVDKPPYCSGTLSLPSDNFLLFFGKDRLARRINLSDASTDDLQHLARTCDAATFGVNHEDVLDESYRKAGKLDSVEFSINFDVDGIGLMEAVRSDLLEYKEEKAIRAEKYKLNVYGEESFFKPHLDTPRDETMFGSLVIVLPTPHKGGALALRHGGKEWTFNSSELLSGQAEPSIAYVAFYSDVEHEVLKVESGYRITITYNLYFVDKPAHVPDPSTIRPFVTNEAIFKAQFKALLDDPTFLPKGGYLGFGLRHQYPLDGKAPGRDSRSRKLALYAVRQYLKGSDALLARVCGELSLKTSFRMVYRDVGDSYIADVMTNQVLNFQGAHLDTELWSYIREHYNGELLMKRSKFFRERVETDVDVHWVTKTPQLRSCLSDC